jgi:o-succinylbenzoate---CoA ligase
MILIDFGKGKVSKLKFSHTDQGVLDFIKTWESNIDHIAASTSGSTGNPKKIEIAKDYIKASVQMSTDAFLFDQKDVFVCNLSIDSIAGKMMVLRAYELKASLIILNPSSDPISQLLAFEKTKNLKFNSLVFAFVPLQVTSAIENERKISVLERAKVILIGGAGISKKLELQLSQLNLPIWATYGMTETVTHIAKRKIGEPLFTILHKVKIAKDTNQTLLINSPTTGYKWLKTNDLVELNETEEKFKLIGRADNIINSGGVKIQLEAIEEKLSTFISSSFFCFGLPDEKLGTKLCCAFLNTSEISVEREQFKGKMTKFEVPKVFFPLEKFIFTASGKIDKLKTIDAYIAPQVSNQ